MTRYGDDDHVGETLKLAREAVINALREAALPPAWYEGRDAVLRIDLVVAAAAPVIEHRLLEWVENDLLPLALAAQESGVTLPSVQRP